MEQSKQDSVIRLISLLRRIGSVIIIFIIAVVIVDAAYKDIHNRIWISNLKEIYSKGISQKAILENEYKTVVVNNKPSLTFRYSFQVEEKMYFNEYTLHQYLPQEQIELEKIFTVHYLQNAPNKNCLNIEGEIKSIESEIEKSSILWLIIKVVGAIVFIIIFLFQIIALFSEIAQFNKPIEIPGYLKKPIQPLEHEGVRYNKSLDTQAKTLEQLRPDSINQIEHQRQPDSNNVSSLTRFANFLIDTVTFSMLTVVLSLMLGQIINPTDQLLITWLIYLILAFSFFGYYIFMETKYQKTIGKFITKTKVVTRDGMKPKIGSIAKRTFCRLIPFDRVSFLFSPNGFHDKFSDTKIIKDKV